MIPPSDLMIEVLNGRSKGGQHTNDCERAPIRVTHVPTGTVATVAHQRSQHHTLHAAIRMIEYHLTDPEVR